MAFKPKVFNRGLCISKKKTFPNTVKTKVCLPQMYKAGLKNAIKSIVEDVALICMDLNGL